MTIDYIRYDLLVQDAMRSVVRTVLADAATKGLPGEHHFYISFDTRADGVVLSPRIKAQYPKDMTIVLQHQFWDLTVVNDRFEVGLSFSGIPERLVIPFRAIIAFEDRSVQFVLRFAVGTEEDTEPAAEDAAGEEARTPARHDRLPPTSEPVPLPANPEAGEPAPEKPADKPAEKPAQKPADEPTTAEVVRLDRFRKK